MTDSKDRSDLRDAVGRIEEDIKHSVSNIWFAGLGALSVARENGSEAFDELVEKGRAFSASEKKSVINEVDEAKSRIEGTVRKLGDELGRLGGELSGKVDSAVTSALQGFGVPTRDEIHTLSQRVEELTAKLEALGKNAKS